MEGKPTKVIHKKVVVHLDFGASIPDVGATHQRGKAAFDRAVADAVKRELARTRRN